MMNDPYPGCCRCRRRKTRPFRILYSNKCTIFLVLLAIFLLIFGFSLVQIQQKKLTDDNLALTMSSTFYVVLPSNVTDYPDNRPNKYRVHLPRPLHLTGNYVCALYSIQYPLSWPSTIGTLEPQWIDIKIREEHPIGQYRSVRIPVSSASLKKPTELVEHLRQALKYAQTEVNTTRLRREAVAAAAADGDEQISPTPVDEYAQPSTTGALCIRRGKRIRCRRRSPAPTEEGTTVKREVRTPPPVVVAVGEPESPPSSADSPDVNVQNIVTVNVSVEPIATAKSSKPKHPPSPPPATTATTTFGSISVRVDPFEDDDDDDDDDDKSDGQQQQQAKKPKPSSPTKPDIRGGAEPAFVDEQQQPKKSTPGTGSQAAFKQLTELIGAIQIDYLKNANGGEDDDDDDDDDDESEQAKRTGKGFENDRFRIRMPHPAISHLEMSEQLAYVLGFPHAHRILDGEIARYAADLHGGFSSFAVYARGLTEDVILGNSLSSLLRIVAVEGNPAQQRHGALIEKIYDSPMYVKVLPREINEIAIEIRTMTGQFVPFQFGNVTLTLVFRKVINL